MPSLIALSVALYLCREPVPPTCVRFGMDLMPTTEALQDCRAAIEAFRHETKRFVDCIDEARAEAIKQLNDAIGQWNSRAAR